MDNSTEYCSFVSIDYIICECGETFPNEDALRVHLENEHASVKHEKPEALKENLPDANIQSSHIYLFDMQDNQVQEEYYLEETSASPTPIQYLLPEDIKQEGIVVQYFDPDDSAIEQDNETVIEEITDFTEPIEPTSKKVVFKKEQIADEVVILAQENVEHDYDREAEKPVMQEYYFCEVCGKSFLTEKSVNMHMQRMHGIGRNQKNIQKKNSVCDVCGKKYAMRERQCSGCGAKRPPGKKQPQKKAVKQFTCDTCGVSTTSNAALRYHQRIHTGERPYKCPECSKTFTMPLFLQLHIRTHTGERPYQCTRCEKAFSNQAALVRHDRVHTGVKPYPCPECGKAFTQSNSMKLHFQTVHLKLPAPYKSAARKLRDMKKGILQQDSARTLKIVRSEHYISPQRSKLLFRHTRPQYEYVVEEATYSDNEYEDDYGDIITGK